jgi:capsular polysaccharide export protein
MPGKAKQAAVKTFSSLINGLILMERMKNILGIYSGGIWRIPHLDSFLPGEHIRLSPFKTIPAQVNAIVVWGQRPSARKPVAMAQSAGLPVIRLEDGFIRSLGLGVQDCSPLSIVVDHFGIYYDASVPSTLECLVKDKAGNQPLAAEAQAMMRAIVDNDLSKYNQAPPFVVPDIMPEAVLVIDQTFGDMSVTKGNAGRKASSRCSRRQSRKIRVQKFG